MQHVGIRQQVVGVRPGPVPLGGRRVTVDRRGADVVETQPADDPELVGRKGFGRRDVQDRAALEHRGERREQIAERFSRGGAGGDDHIAAAACMLRHGDLVLPRSLHAREPQPVGESPGTQDGQGAARPSLAGMCSTWVSRPPRARSASSRAALPRPSGESVRVRTYSGVPVGTSSPRVVIVCHPRADVPRIVISYRHIVRAWLNGALREHALAAGSRTGRSTLARMRGSARS